MRLNVFALGVFIAFMDLRIICSNHILLALPETKKCWCLFGKMIVCLVESNIEIWFWNFLLKLKKYCSLFIKHFELPLCVKCAI